MLPRHPLPNLFVLEKNWHWAAHRVTANDCVGPRWPDQQGPPWPGECRSFLESLRRPCYEEISAYIGRVAGGGLRVGRLGVGRLAALPRLLRLGVRLRLRRLRPNLRLPDMRLPVKLRSDMRLPDKLRSDKLLSIELRRLLRRLLRSPTPSRLWQFLLRFVYQFVLRPDGCAVLRMSTGRPAT
jgi:hypothetical protein